MGALLLSSRWPVLAALLAATLIAAAACEREVTDLQGEELTYRLAAESLARDLDLAFTESDRQRLERLPAAPGLALLPAGQPEAWRYDVPTIYPLLLAPFVLLAPIRGPALLNALLLTLSAVLASRALQRRIGGDAPAVLAMALFASVTYRYVFVVQPALLLAAAVSAVFSLVFASEEPSSGHLREVYRAPDVAAGFTGRWLLSGALLGVVIVHHWLYSLLVLPAAVAAPGRRRRAALALLAVGLMGVLLPAGMAGGAADAAAKAFGELSEAAGRQTARAPVAPASPGSASGAASPFEPAAGRLLPRRFSVGLTVWNLLYFGFGRNTGVVPYFLPMVALLALWRGGSGRSVLAVTGVLGGLIFALVSPFDFYGGPAAVGNRWLLPWFAAIWFVPTRPLPRPWLALTGLLAAPLMAATWLAPSPDLIAPDGIYRHAGGWHQRWLPVETTQRHLPPAGEARGETLWVRSLSRAATLGAAGRWRLRGDVTAELQLAAPAALESVYLQFGPQAEPELEVSGGRLGEMVLLPEGGVGFKVAELKRRALHPMWWGEQRYHNYVLRLRMPMDEPRPQSLSITAFAEDLRGDRR